MQYSALGYTTFNRYQVVMIIRGVDCLVCPFYLAVSSR